MNLRTFEELKEVIKDKPLDYDDILDSILELAIEVAKNPSKKIECESKMYNVFDSLREPGRWKRKHVYLLSYDLMDNHDTVYKDFDIIPSEIIRDLVAYHSAVIRPIAFDGEPKEQLDDYIGSYEWIYE